MPEEIKSKVIEAYKSLLDSDIVRGGEIDLLPLVTVRSFYRAKHGFVKASIAVIVQKMIDSEKSGVMFTVDPTTGENEVLIEAV